MGLISRAFEFVRSSRYRLHLTASFFGGTVLFGRYAVPNFADYLTETYELPPAFEVKNVLMQQEQGHWRNLSIPQLFAKGKKSWPKMLFAKKKFEKNFKKI